jgi:hypothetical protein
LYSESASENCRAFYDNYGRTPREARAARGIPSHELCHVLGQVSFVLAFVKIQNTSIGKKGVFHHKEERGVFSRKDPIGWKEAFLVKTPYQVERGILGEMPPSGGKRYFHLKAFIGEKEVF